MPFSWYCPVYMWYGLFTDFALNLNVIPTSIGNRNRIFWFWEWDGSEF